MITIFAVPRAFEEQIAIIQRNAILSWIKTLLEAEIILFGDDRGVAEIAKELNIRHWPDIKKNEFGTPLVSDIFEKAQNMAKFDTLCYINGDIILLPGFIEAVNVINLPQFLIVGKRWDLKQKEVIDFSKDVWEEKLKEKIKKEGKLHGPTGIDYFVFRRGAFREIPPFALGRTCWDNWFLYSAWQKNIPIIDATKVAMVIHQNHDYSHHQDGKRGIFRGEEAKKNLKLAGGGSKLFTIRDADFVLADSGLKKQKLTIYSLLSFPFRYFEKVNLFFRPFLFPGWLAFILWRKIRIRKI